LYHRLPLFPSFSARGSWVASSFRSTDQIGAFRRRDPEILAIELQIHTPSSLSATELLLHHQRTPGSGIQLHLRQCLDYLSRGQLNRTAVIVVVTLSVGLLIKEGPFLSHSSVLLRPTTWPSRRHLDELLNNYSSPHSLPRPGRLSSPWIKGIVVATWFLRHAAGGGYRLLQLIRSLTV
jgi:hypothetical protein